MLNAAKCIFFSMRRFLRIFSDGDLRSSDADNTNRANESFWKKKTLGEVVTQNFLTEHFGMLEPYIGQSLHIIR